MMNQYYIASNIIPNSVSSKSSLRDLIQSNSESSEINSLIENRTKVKIQDNKSQNYYFGAKHIQHY